MRRIFDEISGFGFLENFEISNFDFSKKLKILIFCFFQNFNTISIFLSKFNQFPYEKFFLSQILRVYRFLRKDRLDLRGRLTSLRHFFFLGRGDFLGQFLDTAAQELEKHGPSVRSFSNKIAQKSMICFNFELLKIKIKF